MSQHSTLTTPTKIALVVPFEKECGVYTYSHFLLEGFSSPSAEKMEAVSNTCGNDILAYEKFARELESKHDIVHIQYEFGRFGKFGISGIATPFFFNAFSHPEKIITTLHELPQTKNGIVHFFQRLFLRTIMEKSHTVIVHTHHMEKCLHEWFPSLASKVVIIPHGMHAPSKISHSKRPSFLLGKKVVGFFGFLTPHKNVEAIIDALAQLPEKYVALIVGGERDGKVSGYLDALKQRAASAGVSSRIHWQGFIPDEKMNQFFSWMDVVVFPYTSVTESGALHLALGNRRIVLASHLPAFAEIENKYKCLATFSNPSDVVHQILSLSTDAKKQKVLMAGMKKFVNERNWKKIGKVHAKLYQRVAAQNKN